MTGSIGLSVEEMSKLATLLHRTSERLTSSQLNVNRAVASTWWAGPDSAAFAERWSSVLSPTLSQRSQDFEALSATIRRQRDEQITASQPDATSGSGLPVGGSPASTGPLTPPVPAGQGTTQSTVEATVPDGGWDIGKSVEIHPDGGRTIVVNSRNPDGSHSETTYKTDLNGNQTTEVVAQKRTDVDGTVTVEIVDKTWFAGYQEQGSGSKTIGGQKVDYEGAFRVGVYAEAKAEGGIDDRNASLATTLGVGVLAQTTATARTSVGAVEVQAKNVTTVGATAEATTTAKIGLDGLTVTAGGKAFAGGSSEVELSASAGGVTGTAGAGVSYGAGGHAEGSATFTAKKVGVKADFGITVGVGFKVKVDVSINPSEVFDNVKDVDLWPF
jgi:hypothetical protein